MGILKLFKKEKSKNKPIGTPKCEDLTDITNILFKKCTISTPKDDNHNTLGEPLDKLIDGDLPWGWVTHKKDFIEPIEKEYSYFLQSWLDARNASPKELYSALKSFVLYMKDVEKLCKSKGECYEFWFTEYLTGKDYLKNRQQELDQLSKTVQIQQAEYERKQKLLSVLESSLTDFLQTNQGILQKDVYKNFDLCVKSEIQDLLYAWEKSGKIQRIKTGNTYKITL